MNRELFKIEINAVLKDARKMATQWLAEGRGACDEIDPLNEAILQLNACLGDLAEARLDGDDEGARDIFVKIAALAAEAAVALGYH